MIKFNDHPRKFSLSTQRCSLHERSPQHWCGCVDQVDRIELIAVAGSHVLQISQRVACRTHHLTFGDWVAGAGSS